MTTYYYTAVENNNNMVAIIFTIPTRLWYSIEWVGIPTAADKIAVEDITNKLDRILHVFRNQTDAHSLNSIVYNWLYHYKAGNTINLITYSASTEDVVRSLSKISNLYTNV
jgi:hypothetical protein